MRIKPAQKRATKEDKGERRTTQKQDKRGQKRDKEEGRTKGVVSELLTILFSRV